jgi:hypothetical protein
LGAGFADVDSTWQWGPLVSTISLSSLFSPLPLLCSLPPALRTLPCSLPPASRGATPPPPCSLLPTLAAPPPPLLPPADAGPWRSAHASGVMRARRLGAAAGGGRRPGAKWRSGARAHQLAKGAAKLTGQAQRGEPRRGGSAMTSGGGGDGASPRRTCGRGIDRVRTGIGRGEDG